MKSIKLAAAAVVFTIVPAMAAAQDGRFFVNGNLGLSDFSAPRWGADHRDNTDTYGALRFGYVWRGALDYGLEAGYADLGQMGLSGSYDYIDSNGQSAHAQYSETLSAKGWLLGANLKYHLDSAWYLSARGGLFQAKTTVKFGPGGMLGRSSQSNSQGYVGLGIGYDLNQSWGIGVGYDYYNLGSGSGHVNTYSANAEFRF